MSASVSSVRLLLTIETQLMITTQTQPPSPKKNNTSNVRIAQTANWKPTSELKSQIANNGYSLFVDDLR